MLKQKDIEKTYWNSKGKYQEFVNNNLDNNKIDELPINKTLKSNYKNMAHAYYRFYNDGDKPRHNIFIDCVSDLDYSIELEKTINKLIEEIQNAIINI